MVFTRLAERANLTQQQRVQFTSEKKKKKAKQHWKKTGLSKSTSVKIVRFPR